MTNPIRTPWDLDTIGAQPFAAGSGQGRCSATNSANQALTDGVPNVVTGWTADGNDGALNPATGIYTVPATNDYSVSAQCGFDPGVESVPRPTGCSVEVQRSTDSGATWPAIAHGQFVYDGSGNAPCFPNVTRLAVPLNKGDLLRVVAVPDSGGVVTTWRLFPLGTVNLFSVALAGS